MIRIIYHQYPLPESALRTAQSDENTMMYLSYSYDKFIQVWKLRIKWAWDNFFLVDPNWHWNIHSKIEPNWFVSLTLQGQSEILHSFVISLESSAGYKVSVLSVITDQSDVISYSHVSVNKRVSRTARDWWDNNSILKSYCALQTRGRHGGHSHSHTNQPTHQNI